MLHGASAVKTTSRGRLNTYALIMRNLAVILGVILVIITLLTITHANAWWIRIFDFPRLQIAVLSFITTILLFQYFGLRRQWASIFMFLVAGVFFYQAGYVIKYTPLYPVEVDEESDVSGKTSFTIIQANILMDNREVERFRAMINEERPDIVSINEVDEWWVSRLDGFKKTYPYSLAEPLPNSYGMILFSKFRLENREINFLVEDDVPSFYATVVLPSGREFDVHCVHPRPPKPGSSTRERDIELLIVGKRVKEAARPAIVVGDLNDVAWSSTSNRFKDYAGVVDPRQGRGLLNTYNVFLPGLRYPLDHFYFTPHFAFRCIERLEPIGSDHFPVKLSLAF